MTDDWYILCGDEERGPFSRVELQERAARGEVGPDTMVRKSTWMDWRRMGEVDALLASSDPSHCGETGRHDPEPVPPVCASGEPVAQRKVAVRIRLVGVLAATILVITGSVAGYLAGRRPGIVPPAKEADPPLPPRAERQPSESADLRGPSDEEFARAEAIAASFLERDIEAFDKAYEDRRKDARDERLLPAETVDRPPTPENDGRVGGVTARAYRSALSPDQVYSMVSPSVVRVVVRNPRFAAVGIGSGFLVSSDGLIATNYHVVVGAYFAEVRFADGTTWLVEGVAALDKDGDLALLKIKSDGLPTVNLADSTLPAIGTRVFAIGNPQGLTNTLSEGLVSGHRETRGGLTALQITAAISQGSSGGPVLNSAGEVIGVTSSYLEGAQNLNFAVPVGRVKKLVEQRGPMRTLASLGAGRLKNGHATELGRVWQAVELKDYARALTLLAALRESQGGTLYYWMALGHVHLMLENYELALDAYRTATRIAPDRPEVYFNLGLAYSRLDRSEAAVGAYRSSAALDPRNPKTFYALAGLYRLFLCR